MIANSLEHIRDGLEIHRCRADRNCAAREIVVLLAAVAVLVAAPVSASAQSAENVAVIINDNSPDSQRIGQAYAATRSIPDSNVIHIRTSIEEAINRDGYARTIEGPIAAAIGRARLHDRVLYLVLTKGVPLRIAGTSGQTGTMASVDSELALLYRRMVGRLDKSEGAVANPYFLGDRDLSEARPFTHRDFDIYLVSRLDAYTADEAVALIDKAASAKGSGRVVLDQRGDASANRTGETWLELASKRLADRSPGTEVVLETTPKPARGHTDVLGYFSWGSTDPQNRVRTSGLTFAPGALAATFVGSDARTFREPPVGWTPTDAANRSSWYAGSPESLTGDLVRDGVTGAAGYVAQPFLNGVVRPQILFPAYLAGFSLVEAFYLSIPHVSWQTVVIGDPLCRPMPGKMLLSRSEIEEDVDEVTGLPALFGKRRLALAVDLSPDIPERAVALTLRADGLSARDDLPGARQALDEAVEMAPRFVVAMLKKAGLEESAGQHDAAIDMYKRVLDIDPSQVVALNNLAFALAVRRNMPSEALPLAKRAVALSPTNPTILDTLGWIHHLLGDNATAAKVMEQAVKTNTVNPEIRLHAAIVFAAVGSLPMAKNQLAVALKLSPELANNIEVKELQARLAK